MNWEKNKVYKSISFAVPYSRIAMMLGFATTGCWFVGLCTSIEDWQSSTVMVAGNIGWLGAQNPELIEHYVNTTGFNNPQFILIGDKRAINAIIDLEVKNIEEGKYN
jgi:hypothetical protein